MGSRPFLGDTFGRTGNNFYQACAVLPVLHKMASENKRGRGINWSTEATEILLDLWGEETVQLNLERSKTSTQMRQVYQTLLVSCSDIAVSQSF